VRQQTDGSAACCDDELSLPDCRASDAITSREIPMHVTAWPASGGPVGWAAALLMLRRGRAR